MFEGLNPLTAGARRRRRPGLESLEERAVPAIIGGIIYHDFNSNGLFDEGERGLAASPLQLRDGAGNVLASTVSGPDGGYQFTERTGPIAPAELSHEAAFEAAPTDHTRTAALPQFDPALGTLTAVDVIAEGLLQSRVQVENLGAGAANVRAGLTGAFTFQAPGAGPLVSNPTAELTGALPAFDGQMDLQGTSAKDFGATPLAAPAVTARVTDPAALEAYVGTGTVSVSEAARAELSASGPGNLLAMANSVASGKVKVVYHYTPSSVLGPGQYTVVQTQQPPGLADGLDTNNNLAPLPGSHLTDVIPVTVARRDETTLTNHFGEVTPPAPPPITTPPPAPPPVPISNLPVVLRLSKSFYFGGLF
jgi:hypothetical protein